MSARVLIVEDERHARCALAEFLTASGYEVRAVGDGEAAAAAAGEFRPDVALCDWLLPGEPSGASLVERLLAAQPDLRIVVMSGLPFARVRAEAGAMPVKEVMAKPVSLFALAERLERLLAA